MNVLLVHDRSEAIEAICQILSADGLNSSDIKVAEDYVSARNLLSQDVFDLLIIDLTIPFNKGKGNPSYEAVDALLTEVFTADSLNAPGDVIGITRDVAAIQLIDSSVGKHLMVTIEEDVDGRWRRLLNEKIMYATRLAQTRYISANRHYLYDALIVTATDGELYPYCDEFDMTEIRHFPGATEFIFKDAASTIRRGVAYSIGRSGQSSAASMSQGLITLFRPQLAIMTGYCGGVKGKVKLGDLVFFEAAYAWDYGKWEEEGIPPTSVFKARPNPIGIETLGIHRIAREYLLSDFNKAPVLLKAIKQKSLGKVLSFDMYLAPVASGSAVVANDTIVSKIRGLNDSIRAVDMEAYGFYHAAQNTTVIRPQFICVKAVSDFCNGEKDDSLHEACSFISSSVAVDLLTNTYRFVGR